RLSFMGRSATAHDAGGGPVRLTNDRTSGGADASGPYPLGTTTVTFNALDSSGNRSTCLSRVTVQDTQAPTLGVYADATVLWPPNHEMVPVRLGWTVQDRCDARPLVEVVSVSSSEPDDAPGTGDGETTGDIAGVQIGAPDGEIL